MSLPAINPMMSMYAGGYDPYLMMALNSYNPYASYTSVPTSQVAVPQTTQITAQQAASTAFQGGQSNAAGGKNKAARVVFPLILTAGAAFLCHKSYKIGQGETFFKRLGNGFKNMFSSVQSSLNKLMPKCPTVTKIGDNVVVTLPDAKNPNAILPKKKGCNIPEEEFVSKLASIGEQKPEIGNFKERLDILADGKFKLKQGNKLTRLDFEYFDEAGTKYEIVASGNGKNIQVWKTVINGRREPLNIETLRLNDNDGIYKDVKSLINNFKAGKAPIRNAKLNKVFIEHTNPETGLKTYIRVNEKCEEEILSCVSEKFPINHKLVIQKTDRDPLFKKAIEAVQNGETDGMKILYAYAPCSALGGTFKVDGKGNVIEFKYDKKNTVLTPKSADFCVLKKENKELFEAAGKKEAWSQIVYKAAA